MSATKTARSPVKLFGFSVFAAALAASGGKKAGSETPPPTRNKVSTCTLRCVEFSQTHALDHTELSVVFVPIEFRRPGGVVREFESSKTRLLCRDFQKLTRPATVCSSRKYDVRTARRLQGTQQRFHKTSMTTPRDVSLAWLEVRPAHLIFLQGSL